jgi:hypothetical protein
MPPYFIDEGRASQLPKRLKEMHLTDLGQEHLILCLFQFGRILRLRLHRLKPISIGW